MIQRCLDVLTVVPAHHPTVHSRYTVTICSTVELTLTEERHTTTWIHPTDYRHPTRAGFSAVLKALLTGETAKPWVLERLMNKKNCLYSCSICFIHDWFSIFWIYYCVSYAVTTATHKNFIRMWQRSSVLASANCSAQLLQETRFYIFSCQKIPTEALIWEILSDMAWLPENGESSPATHTVNMQTQRGGVWQQRCPVLKPAVNWSYNHMHFPFKYMIRKHQKLISTLPQSMRCENCTCMKANSYFTLGCGQGRWC